MAVIRFFVNNEQHDKLLAAAREAGVSPGQFAKALACGAAAHVDLSHQISREIAESEKRILEYVQKATRYLESKLAQPPAAPRPAQQVQTPGGMRDWSGS